MPFNPAIEHHFAALPDPRIERSKRHNLLDVLVIALCAAICGADDFVGIEAWGKAKEGWLKGRLELKGGIPSHTPSGASSPAWTRRHSPAAWPPGPAP